MRPIFTIHAGEYLVANEVERLFPHLRIWVPSKDTGIDLLVTDTNQNKLASLQVKFSKDHLATGMEPRATPEIKSGGWRTFKRDKLESSPADYWVLVLSEFTTRKFDFLIVPPQQLANRYARLINTETNNIQTYFWVTRNGKCWETRGLGKIDLANVCTDQLESESRDFTKYLNAWPFINV